ncbi:MAG: DNA-protecting protein DprA [Candidatus Rokubacteria bacterium]|nr:DNA-protecting protein DprA [Candidatus Rokubacteria bacterium]
MSRSISPNTQAILLLTAPLVAGRGESSSDSLTQSEYKQLARFLRDKHRQPFDLLGSDAVKLITECQSFIDSDRLERLMARGFLLAQAIEGWQARAIWVVSRADSEYPRRLKARLRDDSPPLLYGCGDAAILDTGGLAVVGSRHVGDVLVQYAEGVGRLAAKARRTIVSGGARGIDQAAMRGALEARGKAAGVVADSLERAALDREHRNLLMEGRLVLISPYDPAAGFNVGHAMQRNKLIYALADAALVVSADYEKGGTWAGAVEQLERLRLVPVYVRSNGETGRGLDALRRRGALPWPNPLTPEELVQTVAAQAPPEGHASDRDLPQASPAAAPTTPAEELFAKVRSLLQQMSTPKTDAEVALELGISKSQAKAWLQRLVQEGVLEKLPRPTRYRSAPGSGRLF